MKLVIRLLGVAALVSVMVVPAMAQDTAANSIKYRQTVMKGIGAHMGAIAAILKGEVSHPDHIAKHAKALAATSPMVLDLFPAGSGPEGGETKALPKIWQDWAGFEVAARTANDEAIKLATIAEGGDLAAIGAQVGVLGKACGACHQPYRSK